ncbi:nucleoside 2-deoxyribosyltransferase [Vibrio vulnificus]|uniref:hypothetical protein n=1 Tax=Vibrio vulnificus TaxID=672 RepID=UPI00165D41A3|nr:hypothetical protein [Vibrio vulnificus]MCU8238607.1 nucleoside 2-deoxyribosyltransferase [Vibrio vulnificus]
MSVELISLLSSLFVAMGALIVALLYYRSSKDRKYNDELNRAELHKLRESYELKIYDLMDRLISNESRWKDTNHLVLSAQEHKLVDKRKSFLAMNGVSDNEKINKKSVFVMTPYHDTFSQTFRDIKECCDSIGLNAMRGDEEHITGDILTHTLKLISRSRLIIANIDGRNPNVFYELGIAHALNKDVILVSSSLEELPVDIKSQRIVVYKKDEDLKPLLKEAITKALV